VYVSPRTFLFLFAFKEHDYVDAALLYSPKLKPSATIAAAAKAKELKSTGVKVYEFTLGEPDFNTPTHICQAAKDAMDAGQTHYTPAAGTPEVKQAICDAYQRDYGLSFQPNQVVVSNGAKHSIHNVLTALCGPGDEVIIPTPYWVSYSALVELTGATPVMVETTEESGFCMNAEQFAQAITPKTKLMMLNNPCNPTGAAYTKAELRALADVLLRHPHVWILTDDMYEHLVYDDFEYWTIAQVEPALYDRTLTMNGVSKAYAMTGWRLGWMVGPPDVIAAATNLQSHLSSNVSNIFAAGGTLRTRGGSECGHDDARGVQRPAPHDCRRTQRY